MTNYKDESFRLQKRDKADSMEMKTAHLPFIEPSKARQYSYFVIPKMLICDPAFAHIDCAAKLIYSLMLNRLSLSAENPEKYSDELGRLYIIYPVEEIGQTLQISKPTVVKMVRQLEKAGLILKKRQGQGKPALIYVLDFTAAITPSDAPEQANPAPEERLSFEKSKNLTSRRKEFELQEVKNFECSKNDLRKNDFSNILPSKEEGQSCFSTTKEQLVEISLPEDDMDELVETVKNQIEYSVLVERRGEEIARAVLSLIVTVLARDGPVCLGKNQYPERFMKLRFRSLTYEDVDYALKKLYETPEVRNKTAYLTALLVNSPGLADVEAAALFAQDQRKYCNEENRNQFRFF